MGRIENIKGYTKKLRINGVVAIPDYIKPEDANHLYNEIKKRITSGSIQESNGDESYKELKNQHTPILDRRTGRDDGMVDVFNMDQEMESLRDFKQDPDITELINGASDERFRPDNLNVYWNRSVTATRDFHADTYSGKFKSFLYLTDVQELEDGPFSYIPGSHKSSFLTRWISAKMNRLLGKPTTDAIFYNKTEKICLTADAGTLIVANQAGYHRGHPQEEGRERMLLTTSYTPE